MPRPPYRPQELQGRVFRGTAAVGDGLLTRAQLRSTAWTRLFRDIYADSRLAPEHGLACRAVALAMPVGVVLAGPSAAWLHGVEFAAGMNDDVHVLRPAGVWFAPTRSVVVHTGAVDPADRTVAQDLPCTAALRTAWDVAVWLDLGKAVVVLDGLLHLGLVTAPALAALVRDRQADGVRGARKAGLAVDLADGGAASPPESVMRIKLVRAGLPRPVTGHPIRLPGGTLRADLAWPDHQVAVEYDNDGRRAVRLDHRRLDQLAGAGWIVLQATPSRLRQDPTTLVHQVRAALYRNGWRPVPGSAAAGP